MLLLGILAAAVATIDTPGLQREKGSYLLQWHLATTRAGEVVLTPLAKRWRMDSKGIAKEESGDERVATYSPMKQKVDQVLFARVFRPPAFLGTAPKEPSQHSPSAAHL